MGRAAFILPFSPSLILPVSPSLILPVFSSPRRPFSPSPLPSFLLNEEPGARGAVVHEGRDDRERGETFALDGADEAVVVLARAAHDVRAHEQEADSVCGHERRQSSAPRAAGAPGPVRLEGLED